MNWSFNRCLEFGSWNVRGLGRPAKCTDVKAAISNFNQKILCLQETKLEEISQFKAMTFLPPSLRSFHFIPSIGASGGILTAWDDRDIECTNVIYNSFSILNSFSSRLTDLSFSVTNVYGPCTTAVRPNFFDELKNLGPFVGGPWTIFGNFNAMLDPDDRSNASFNSSDAALFSATINTLLLQEIPLLNRHFTW
jgi:exonuclease III